MKKKADWKQDFKKFLQNNRQAVGVGLAGLGGGLVGSGLLPGLIYKKPTLANRFILGGGTGLLTALGVIAALSKNKQIPSTAANAAKQGLSGIKQLPSTLLGGMPTAKQFQEMGSFQRMLYGKQGTGPIGWGIRNIKRALPNINDIFGKSQTDKKREEAGLSFKTSDDTYLSRALGNLLVGGAAAGGTQMLTGNMAKNFNRAREVGDLIVNAKNNLAGLDAGALHELEQLRSRASRSGIGSLWELLKAHTTNARARLANTGVGKALHLSAPSGRQLFEASQELTYNPFRQRAAVGPGGNVTNRVFQDLAQKTSKNPKLKDLTNALGRNSKLYSMPKARGLLNRLGRTGRLSLPMLAALLTGSAFNSITGANKDYNAMVSQPLYKDL